MLQIPPSQIGAPLFRDLTGYRYLKGCLTGGECFIRPLLSRLAPNSMGGLVATDIPAESTTASDRKDKELEERKVEATDEKKSNEKDEREEDQKDDKDDSKDEKKYDDVTIQTLQLGVYHVAIATSREKFWQWGKWNKDFKESMPYVLRLLQDIHLVAPTLFLWFMLAKIWAGVESALLMHLSTSMLRAVGLNDDQI